MTEGTRPLAVGDTGIVRSEYRRGDRKGIVVKVGRRWATVEDLDFPGREIDRFDKTTGQVDGRGYHSRSTFYTDERWARRQLLLQANETIQAHGIAFSYRGRRWSEDDHLALAAWLTDHFAPRVEEGETPSG